MAPTETALLREPLSGSGVSVAVPLLCVDVSFRPAVPAVGKVLAVTATAVLPLRGPAVCLPSHLRTWPRGSPCLEARGRSAPKAAACRGQRTGRVISTTWKLNSERVLVCGGGYNNNSTEAQTGQLTDSGRSLLMVWRPDARLVGSGAASARLFLTGSSHGRWSERPLGGPFIRALVSFMRAPPL